MLSAMRSKVSGYIAKFLMLLLIISFAIWGIGDIGNGNFGSFVASVGSERISVAEFQQQSRIMSRAAETAGIKDINPAILQQHILRQLIEERLTKLSLHRIGLSVGESLLAKELRQAPNLQNPDGTFSAKTFQSMLRQRQMNEKAFLAQLKTELNNQTIIDSVTAVDMALPPSYLALNARAAGQTRDAMIVTISPTSAKAEAASEEDLKEYYDQQKEILYRQPERRTLDYATITQADIGALIAKEKDLAPDEARDRVMQDISNRIEDALAAGRKMGDALKEAGLHPTVRQLVNILADAGTDELSRAVVAQGFQLSQGETSNLEVAKGGTYFLVTVSALTPAAPKKFEDVKSDVAKRLAEEARQDAVTLRAQSIMDALRKSGDWKAVLAEQKISGQQMSGISLTGGGALPDPLRQAIFEHAVGGAAGPLTTANGNAMIAIVTGVHAGTQTKLDEKSRKKLSDDLNQEIFAQYFNSMVDRYPVEVDDKVFAKARKTEPNE